MRYFLKLAYNGAPYHGWQSQPNALGVQQVIEEALATLLREPTPITGAGRTDTGVNARMMYAHLDSERIGENPRRLLRSLNLLCGKDIAIGDIIPVPPDANARFDAVSRTYKYFVAFDKTPFLYPFSWLCPSRLSLGKMNEAAALLLPTEDFTSFAKLHSDTKTNICHVSHACWEPMVDGAGAVFTITANRFLRNMVRAITGTLVDVGRGKLSLSGFADIIEARNRCSAGTSMPGNALFLWDIQYPETILPPQKSSDNHPDSDPAAVRETF